MHDGSVRVGIQGGAVIGLRTPGGNRCLKIHSGRPRASAVLCPQESLPAGRQTVAFDDAATPDPDWRWSPSSPLTRLVERLMRITVLPVAFAFLLPIAGGAQPAADVGARVDRIFARYTKETPGCAVGVARNGRETFAKAYGMADL